MANTCENTGNESPFSNPDCSRSTYKMAARVCCFCLAKHFTRNLKFVTQGSLSARPDICRNTLLLLDICVYDRRYISSGVETARVGARERRVAPPVACPTPRWNGAALRGIPFINSGVTALNLRNFTATDLRKTSGGHNTDQKRQMFGAFKEIVSLQLYFHSVALSVFVTISLHYLYSLIQLQIFQYPGSSKSGDKFNVSLKSFFNSTHVRVQTLPSDDNDFGCQIRRGEG